MKIALLVAAAVVTTSAMAAERNSAKRKPSSADITIAGKDGKALAAALRKAEQSGNESVQFGGGPKVTQYSIERASVYCYFQNSDDSAECTISSTASGQ